MKSEACLEAMFSFFSAGQLHTRTHALSQVRAANQCHHQNELDLIEQEHERRSAKERFTVLNPAIGLRPRLAGTLSLSLALSLSLSHTHTHTHAHIQREILCTCTCIGERRMSILKPKYLVSCFQTKIEFTFARAGVFSILYLFLLWGMVC